MSCQLPYPMSDIPSIEAIEFCQAMRNLASGVAIVATGTAAERRGLTASPIASICMEPPSFLVGINAGSESYSAILANGTFGVSLLGDQQDLALRLAVRHGAKGVHRFDTAPWDHGCPRRPGSAKRNLRDELRTLPHG
ncbi:flavin reductase family protein [Bradyrhizobium sp. USDA 10063]